MFLIKNYNLFLILLAIIFIYLLIFFIKKRTKLILLPLCGILLVYISRIFALLFDRAYADAHKIIRTPGPEPGSMSMRLEMTSESVNKGVSVLMTLDHISATLSLILIAIFFVILINLLFLLLQGKLVLLNTFLVFLHLVLQVIPQDLLKQILPVHLSF